MIMTRLEYTMLKVNVIGIGPGNPDLLTAAARKAIEECTILAGDKRMICQFEEGRKIYPTIKLADLMDIAGSADHEKDILGILVSGDVGFFSLARTIAGKLPQCDVKRYCGISSLVYFASRLEMSWDDAKIISMHGRSQNLVSAVLRHQKVFSLTGGDNSPQSLCGMLCRQGLGDVTVHVGSDLSYPEEQIVSGSAAEIAKGHFPSLSVMMILNEKAGSAFRQSVHGLDDSLFVRGSAPMTKQEIREAVLEILSDIAPDEDLSGLKDDVSFREQMELDSMDFLDIVMELRRRYKVNIPEEEYTSLGSMNSTVEYLAPKMAEL